MNHCNLASWLRICVVKMFYRLFSVNHYRKKIMGYKLLFHNEVDFKGLEKNFLKTIRQLQDADFKSADVRKMGATNFYRARLSLKDRLLFKPVKHNGTTALLLLEWIKDHNYARSLFLRGALLPPDDQLVPVPAQYFPLVFPI